MSRRVGGPFRDDIVAIQALRWLAASLVVWVHGQHEIEKVAARAHRAVHFSRAVELGVGVDIFFCISGFLICLVSRGQFARAGAPGGFLLRRVLRIVPLYWLATGAMLAATIAVPSLLNHDVLSPVQAPLSFFMVAWPDRTGRVFPLLESGWTLNVEFYFYACFAVALRFRRRWALPLLACWFALTVAVDQAWAGSPWWLDFYAQPIVLEFACGVGLAVLYERGLRVPAALAIAGAAGAVALHLGLRAACHPPRVIGNGVPAAVLFASLVSMRGPRCPAPLARLLRLMGDASYALYLTSPFAINVVVEVLTRHGVARSLPLLAASYIVSLAVAVTVFLWVEGPMTRAGRRLLDRRGRVAAGAGGAGAEGAARA